MGRQPDSVNDQGIAVDAVIVGAGFAGLYMLYRLREMGFEAIVLERGSGVGGTWYWNRYPGARCDVESMQYSYQFSDALQQEWVWTERYAAQPEILRYANHVADRFDLWPAIRFGQTVTSATFDEERKRWLIETADGLRLSAQFCVMATGCLSSTNRPDLPGLDQFAGEVLHTGSWPKEEVDFAGRCVGVIGTGSSAIQSIPIIAEQAKHLYVFQRTPNYAVPAQNGPLPPEVQQAIKADYPAMRARARTTRNGIDFPIPQMSAHEVDERERQRVFEAQWQAGGLGFISTFNDLLVEKEANDTAAAFVRAKLREIVHDPAVADLLCPDNILGCKRLCVDIGYYQTYNRSNVTLVDISASPLERITAGSIHVSGKPYDVDAIVLATGFDAMTGALNNIAIRGRKGELLSSAWQAGPKSYLGLMIKGFPNLFTITGPGSPSVLTNMLPTIEQHVEWIADCIRYMQTRDLTHIEPTNDAQNAWVDHVNEIAAGLLYPSCNSWYLGANVPGKPRVFMPYPGFATYVSQCNEVVARGYQGFSLS